MLIPAERDKLISIIEDAKIKFSISNRNHS